MSVVTLRGHAQEGRQSAEAHPLDRRTWIGFVHRHRLLLVLLALSAVYFFYFYMQNENRPGAVHQLGWNGWADQERYLREARAIRTGSRNWVEYAYPMGYPMVAVPFLDLLPRDPFLPVNMASFLAVMGLSFATARRFVGPALAFIGGLLLMLATPLLTYTAVPWTTTPALLAVAWWTYVLLARRRIDLLAVAVGGPLLGWAYLARGGGEWALLAPLGLAAAWRHRKDPRIVIHVALLIGILVAVVGANALWTKAIFGTFQHPYFSAVADVGFVPSAIPDSFWGAIIYSGPEGEYWPTLGVGAFWLVFAPVGMYLAARRPDGIVHRGMIASIVLGLLVVSSFPAFSAGALKYQCLHYVKLWLPVLALYSLIGMRSFLSEGAATSQPRRRTTEASEGPAVRAR